MDGQRFDHWTQTLARKLSQGRGTEFSASSRRLDQPAPRTARAAPAANGTCAQQEVTAAGPGTVGQGGTPGCVAICGWEQPAAVPASNENPQLPRTGRSARRQPGQRLSAREQEIAELIARGLTDRQIAAALVLSEHTVHAHVRNVLDKLGVASRTQIAAWIATRAADHAG